MDYGLTASASDHEAGPRFLRITDIVSGHIDWNAVPHVAADDETTAKYRLHDGDVVLARTGASTGASAYVKNPPPAVFASYLVRLKAKPDFDSRFLAYYLKSEGFWTFIRGVLGDKSAQPNASASTMTKAPLRAPRDKDEQRAIAHILGTLDDKIELNRRMSETLEAMARALFQSWFVDFDPVRWKMERKDAKAQSRNENKTSLASSRLGDFAFPPALADLFPDSFEDSELGEIPRGWEVKAIRCCCVRVQNGGTPRRDEPSYWSNGDIPWLTSSEVRQSIVMSPEGYITEAGLATSSAKWVDPLSTVVALYGATAGEVSLVATRLTTNQAICSLIPKDRYAFFNYLSMRNAISDLKNKAVGSAQQNISKAIVEETLTIFPPIAVIKEFACIVEPLIMKWISNLGESRTLAALRDALLPKLISGELRVKDAEKIIEREDAMTQGRKGEKS
jgi:type I restriction enzyme S subunit